MMIFLKKEKRLFIESENAEIFSACEKIRSVVCENTRIEGKGIVDKKLFRQICKGSFIDQYIQQKEWKNLFTEKEWLCLLKKIYNQNSFIEELKVIKKYFEKETAKYLKP